MRRFLTVAAVLGLVALAPPASASIIIDTAPVANLGNDPDTRYATPGYGGVSYAYNIGQYEVTAGQYADFLNHVAATDTYGLYTTLMGSSSYGCKIQRSGTPGSYTYTVAGDWADRPVTYVSWGDAARFSNWLHNGQPTGPQGLGTTEDGSYFLNGAINDAALLAILREPDATWVIPSEDEWYKAAYHKNEGVTADYFDYPTSSDNVPSNQLINPDPGNSANFTQNGGLTMGSPYYRTVVGEFENSPSPYGTFDQGGNVMEWNETVIGSYRGARGGSFNHEGDVLRAAARYGSLPTIEGFTLGFRVCQVPEPASLAPLALVGLGLRARRRK